MSNLETELLPFGKCSRNQCYRTLAGGGNMNKYQQKSTSKKGDCIFAKNDDGDDIESDLR